MTPIRAKFLCQSVTKSNNSGDPGHPYLYTYKFSAVTSGSDENKRFWRWTPSGFVELSSVLVDAFEPGKEYYLDFSDPLPPSNAGP